MNGKAEKTFADSLRARLCKLFLHCVFTNPEFIVGSIKKHLEATSDDVALRYERSTTDEQGNELAKYYTIFLYGNEFILRYDKRVEEPKEIDVPKVVNKPKKWWKREYETMAIVERKKSSKTPILHWVLNCID